MVRLCATFLRRTFTDSARPIRLACIRSPVEAEHSTAVSSIDDGAGGRSCGRESEGDVESVDFVASLPVLLPSSDEMAVAGSGPSSDAPCASVVGNTLVAWASSVDRGHRLALEAVLAFVQCSLRLPTIARIRGPTRSASTTRWWTSSITVGSPTRTSRSPATRPRGRRSGWTPLCRRFWDNNSPNRKLSTVSSALTALNSDASHMGEAWSIFSRNSAAGSAGSFSAGLAEVITSGEPGVSMSLSAFKLGRN